MCIKIANTLETKKENISIKGTTTEGLGFTGRKEGISCYCVATIKQEQDILNMLQLIMRNICTFFGLGHL